MTREPPVAPAARVAHRPEGVRVSRLLRVCITALGAVLCVALTGASARVIAQARELPPARPPGGGLAQPASWPDALTGASGRIRQTGVVRIGYREGAVPFSYLGPGKHPVGYTLDLCSAVVDEISEELGRPLRIEYVPVTPADRIARIVAGELDLECGSTSITAERRRQVAFSPLVFITGTRLAVPRGSTVREPRDLRGRLLGTVAGTSNEAAMRELDRARGLGIRFVPFPGYREAVDALAARTVDALAADDILLRGALIESRRTAEFRLVGEMLSFEPYGIVYAQGDPVLEATVDGTLRKLARSREIVWIYNRWFVRRLPSGERLDLPMSEQLRRSFELLGLPPD